MPPLPLLLLELSELVAVVLLGLVVFVPLFMGFAEATGPALLFVDVPPELPAVVAEGDVESWLPLALVEPEVPDDVEAVDADALVPELVLPLAEGDEGAVVVSVVEEAPPVLVPLEVVVALPVDVVEVAVPVLSLASLAAVLVLSAMERLRLLSHEAHDTSCKSCCTRRRTPVDVDVSADVTAMLLKDRTATA